MFDLVNVEGKLVYSLRSETFHGTIASINPSLLGCAAHHRTWLSSNLLMRTKNGICLSNINIIMQHSYRTSGFILKVHIDKVVPARLSLPAYRESNGASFSNFIIKMIRNVPILCPEMQRKFLLFP